MFSYVKHFTLHTFSVHVMQIFYATLYVYYILWHECNNLSLLPGNISVASLQPITVNNLPAGYIDTLIFCPPKYKLDQFNG